MQVPKEPINLGTLFEDDALLLNSSSHMVQVNEWGFTMEGLEHGATYFLVLYLHILIPSVYIYIG